MKNIIKLTAITSAILAPTLVQAQATSPMEVSATVIPGCFIEADNINFGNLITPITNQSATSNMRVHCSKGSNLEINISYDNQGTISGSNNGNKYGWKVLGTHSDSAGSYEYTSITINGISTGENDIECWNKYPGKLLLHSSLAKNLFGYAESGSRIVVTDTFSACNSGNTKFNTSFNISSAIAGIKGGILTGVVKREQIKYSLEKPGSASTIWDSSNGYTLTANGQSQTIPMKANIVSADNPTHRMSPDSYQDTLTVVLTY